MTTTEIDAFFGGDADYHGPPRDRYKRPMLIPTAEYPGLTDQQRDDAAQARKMVLEGEVVPANHPGRQPFTRASSMAGYIADFKALHTWRQRRVVKGLAMRPDLAAMAAALPPFKNNSKDDRLTNARLDEIMAETAEWGQIHEQANWGTAVHSWTEPGVDLSGVHAEYRADVQAFWDELRRLGIEILDTEVFTANNELKAAGTIDHRLRVPGYGVVLADKKTGDVKPLEFAVQFATYRFGDVYDWETDNHAPWPDDTSADVALVLDIPKGKGELRIHEIDLRWGLECARIAADVRTRHSDSKSRIFKQVNDKILEAGQLGVTQAIKAAKSRQEIVAIWETHHESGLWTSEHDRQSVARVKSGEVS